MNIEHHVPFRKFIGTKTILARAMTRGEYNVYRGWEMPADEDGAEEGYLVEYLDGGKANHPAHTNYISWSPAPVFERAYREEPEGSYQERVVAEKYELDAKLDKLMAFIKANLVFASLPVAEQARLEMQASAMSTYSRILRDRIEAWTAPQ